jgi:tRNA (cytosine38-C5)-methyltransferase
MAADLLDAELHSVELFSGIGGYHFALNLSKAKGIVHIVQAFDVNVNANLCYSHNFSTTEISTKTLDRIGHSDFHPNIRCWFLSPPCQPYTLGGSSKGANDTRSSPLNHILDCWEGKQLRIPDFLLLENVPQFFGSSSHERISRILSQSGRHVEHFLICPHEIGVSPNKRKRFYLLSRPMTPSEKEAGFLSNEITNSFSLTPFPTIFQQPQNLSEFLWNGEGPPEIPELIVSDDWLQLQKEFRFHVVSANSRLCHVFTKGYMQHPRSSASLICLDQSRGLGEEGEYVVAKELVSKCRLRFFTVEEVSRLLCFPPTLKFPQELTSKQRYQLLGNSVNVEVVKILIDKLFSNHIEAQESVG